jgi:serine/threonine-protein kinase CHEK2
LSQPHATPLDHNAQLPSPVTHQSTAIEQPSRPGTATPPEGRPSQITHRTPPADSPLQNISSPPPDTQPLSQWVLPSSTTNADEKDDNKEVWGYLIPLDQSAGDTLVLSRRSACPGPDQEGDFGHGSKSRVKGAKSKKTFAKEEDAYEEKKESTIAAGGYLIGRHPECGLLQQELQNV